MYNKSINSFVSSLGCLLTKRATSIGLYTMNKSPVSSRRLYMKLYMREYYLKNKDKCAKWHHDYIRRHSINRSAYSKSRRQKIRVAVLTHYSGELIMCKCCGEKEMKFLSIDHIDGGGNMHRRSIKYASLTEWLYRNKYPKGYQILCYNCNSAKGIYGICPHKSF